MPELFEEPHNLRPRQMSCLTRRLKIKIIEDIDIVNKPGGRDIHRVFVLESVKQNPKMSKKEFASDRYFLM